MLQLGFYSYKLLAFGLLTTVLPTGPGYSLIAMVDAEFPPIQLGFGFTLAAPAECSAFTARRASTRSVPRSRRTRCRICCSPSTRSPMRRSSSRELDTLSRRRTAASSFGPLLRIAWGTPAAADARSRAHPRAAGARCARAHRRADGGASETRRQARRDPPERARHHRLRQGRGRARRGAARFAPDEVRAPRLDGACGWTWSGQKTFLLAIGGAHPKFQLPPGFPKLDRVGISMPSGKITKLNLDGYIAITSNTLADRRARRICPSVSTASASRLSHVRHPASSGIRSISMATSRVASR